MAGYELSFTPWYDEPLDTCPICDKKFARAKEHYWKISKGNVYMERTVPVCTYSCMRVWEKQQEEKAKAKWEGKKKPYFHKTLEFYEERRRK